MPLATLLSSASSSLTAFLSTAPSSSSSALVPAVEEPPAPSADTLSSSAPAGTLSAGPAARPPALTLHAISTLYFSAPPVAPHVLRPVLQVLSVVPGSVNGEGNTDLLLLLSDGVHCLRATFSQPSALTPESSSTRTPSKGGGGAEDEFLPVAADGAVDGSLASHLSQLAVVQLEDYGLTEGPGATRHLAIYALSVLHPILSFASETLPLTLPRRIGRPRPIELATPPSQPATLPSSPVWTSSRGMGATSTPSAPASVAASASGLEDDDDTAAAVDDQVDGCVRPGHSAANSPCLLAADSTSAAGVHRPRLPLELQAMILKDVLALYRVDDKRQRDGDKQRARDRAAGVVVDSSAEKEAQGGGSGGRWALVLVCRDWHALALPDLYKTITLSHPTSYALFATELASPRGRQLRKWVRRAVLRAVPSTTWADRTTAVGGVLAGLSDLESLKVRFEQSGEGRHAGMRRARVPLGPEGAVGEEDEGDGAGGAGAQEQQQQQQVGAGQAEPQAAQIELGEVVPSVWEWYPNLNPRIFHQHHLHTFALPGAARCWPRLRVSSSELVFCLTHPPPSAKFPALPLRSHHLTVFLAGDPSRAHRFARFLARLCLAPPALADVRLSVRCASALTADQVELALLAHVPLMSRARTKGWTMEVGWGTPPASGEGISTSGIWTTRVVGSERTGAGQSQQQQHGAINFAATPPVAAIAPAWAAQAAGLVLGPLGGAGVGVAEISADAAAEDGDDELGDDEGVQPMQEVVV